MNVEGKLKSIARELFKQHGCPNAEELASYSLKLLAGNDELRVAAHVRSCPRCTMYIDLSRPSNTVLDWVDTPLPVTPSRLPTIVARLLMTPVVQGVRSSSSPTTSTIRQYTGSDLNIEVTVSLYDGEFGDITGRVFRNGTALEHIPVILRSREKRYEQQSDTQGIFTFQEVPSGRYTLTVQQENVRIQIRGLMIGTEELPLSEE